MNTTGDQNPDILDLNEPGKIAFPVEVVTKTDEQINELQEQIQDGKDKANEITFVLILFATIVFDYFLFRDLTTGIGISFICLLEAMGLLVLCKRLGIEEPYIFLVSTIKRLMNRIGKEEDEEKKGD